MTNLPRNEPKPTVDFTGLREGLARTEQVHIKRTASWQNIAIIFLGLSLLISTTVFSISTIKNSKRLDENAAAFEQRSAHLKQLELEIERLRQLNAEQEEKLTRLGYPPGTPVPESVPPRPSSPATPSSIIITRPQHILIIRERPSSSTSSPPPPASTPPVDVVPPSPPNRPPADVPEPPQSPQPPSLPPPNRVPEPTEPDVTQPESVVPRLSRYVGRVAKTFED